MKTPITSIQGYVEAITGNEEIRQNRLEQYLKVIHNNVVYMNRLIDDLFLFSKLDMQKLEFNFIEINICPFIADMMEEFKLELEEKDTGFEFNNMLTMDHIVKLDAKRFYRIIRNIIDNAVKYGPNFGDSHFFQGTDPENFQKLSNLKPELDCTGCGNCSDESYAKVEQKCNKKMSKI